MGTRILIWVSVVVVAGLLARLEAAREYRGRYYESLRTSFAMEVARLAALAQLRATGQLPASPREILEGPLVITGNGDVGMVEGCADVARVDDVLATRPVEEGGP